MNGSVATYLLRMASRGGERLTLLYDAKSSMTGRFKVKTHENEILIPFGLATSTQDQSWLTL